MPLFTKMPTLFAKRQRWFSVLSKVIRGKAETNSRLSAKSINISGQFLKTNDEIGYVILDVDTKFSKEAVEILQDVKGTIKTRMVY